MASLKLTQVRKTFEKGGNEIIAGVDLEIRDGEFMVLVGPSGCGKSTLLRMIAGLESITSGDMYIGDDHVNDVEPADRGIAMVFQSYALYPHMTVADNMGFALKLAGHKKAEVREAVERVADTLQISHLLASKPKNLSGGQRQRVAIGRAIVRKPKVFLFDEPLSNLDAALRVQMRTELARLHALLETTMVYVTHDQVEAMTLGQRIAVINQGRIEQVGEPRLLYERPANLFVAGFLGSPKMNMLPGVISAIAPDGLSADIALDCQGQLLGIPAKNGPIQAAIGAKVTVGVRPDHLTLMPNDAQGRGVPSTLEFVERLGEAILLYLQPEGLGQASLISRIPGDATVPPAGSNVDLHATQALLFNEQGLLI